MIIESQKLVTKEQKRKLGIKHCSKKTGAKARQPLKRKLTSYRQLLPPHPSWRILLKCSASILVTLVA